MSFCAFISLLALSESDQPTLVWWLIAALIATGPALYYWLKVWEMFQGRKVDHSQFITRAEFAQAKLDRDRQISDTLGVICKDLDDVRAGMNALQRSVHDELSALHRSLGRVEGHVDESATQPRRRPRA